MGRRRQRAADRQRGVRRNPRPRPGFGATCAPTSSARCRTSGVFETGEGALPDPGAIELVKTPGGWRIDRLPNGVFLDWQQFQSTYKRNTLYFVDPTGNTVVPDPRYVAVSDPDQLATELVSKLIAGPRPEMDNTVRNLLGPPLQAAWSGDPRRRRQDGCRPRLRRCPHRPGEPVDDRPAHPATACGTDHLDACAGRHQRPVCDQRRRCGARRPFRRRLEHLRRRGHRPWRGPTAPRRACTRWWVVRCCRLTASGRRG